MTLQEAAQLPEDHWLILYIDYTNWKGIRAWRRVIPLGEHPEYLSKVYKSLSDSRNPNAEQKGWVIHVYDLDKKARRSYFLDNCHEITTEKPENDNA